MLPSEVKNEMERNQTPCKIVANLKNFKFLVLSFFISFFGNTGYLSQMPLLYRIVSL